MGRTYFDLLGSDLQALGLLTADGRQDLHEHPLYFGLYELVNRSGKLFNPFAQLEDTQPIMSREPIVHTQLGKRILDCMEPDALYPLNPGIDDCCSEAEARLLKNIKDERVADDFFASPVIIAEDSKPIAIIKTNNEHTCYGLVDKPESGLIAGTFSTPELTFDTHSLPKTRQAWVLDAKDLLETAPIRFSTLSTPLESREQLIADDYDQPVLQTSHGDIYRQAEQLLPRAWPINPADYV